jgi:hypothetical protein
MRTFALLRLPFALLASFTLSACDSGTGISSTGDGSLPACGLSVQGGHYGAGTDLNVMVSQDVAGADIRFTLDSTVPARTSSRYSGWGIPIRIDSGSHVVLTVRAWSANDSSPWTRATYFN